MDRKENLMGEIVGGALLVISLGLLIGKAFRSKAPNLRAVLAAGTAWVAAGILAGFGMARGEVFRFEAILIYLPGAVIAFLYLRWHYGKDWIDDEGDVVV
jgi:hypothetical protein